MAKRVAGLGQRLTSSGHRQSATSRDASDERRHYPSGPRVPGRRPTNRFESIDRSANYRRAGARPSLPSRPPPKPPLPQISKVGFGASGTPVQRGASQGGTPSGSEKRDGGEPSKDVKGQGEDAGQPGASGGPLGGAGGGGRRPGDDERDDDKRKKGKGSSSGGGEKKKEEQEKKAKKERDQREEAKKESKPVDGREARGKEVKQGGGGLSSDSGKGSTGEEAGKKKAKKDRGRRAIEETVGDVTDAGVTSEATEEVKVQDQLGRLRLEMACSMTQGVLDLGPKTETRAGLKQQLVRSRSVSDRSRVEEGGRRKVLVLRHRQDRRQPEKPRGQL
ncbi:putative toxoplasma gondii family E protein [Toxoplasma gondii CAST]|uniref:Putative toxoplasma gondii family E protein n=1 Tax=Toxoplasma gondii CAST TaxID=943122 RepID=A0A662YLV4_TOXGO|nr:putative toxoplasma gondii family E protein [Toxoplasma gondii CAST]